MVEKLVVLMAAEKAGERVEWKVDKRVETMVDLKAATLVVQMDPHLVA